ncbi:sensor histidine kinase [Maribellus maritimus]|uniref:sensor histidine kinase n=1 Tax=Maribellus maritimus TaxID=2870838 RepID=UPI001EEC1E95|nr:HAMP domain-containing sensor histidine kinase [Maribellus maritimus]MCG6186067.1 HAMP domain-containing histidine kinase [Maribellus maritimus]
MKGKTLKYIIFLALVSITGVLSIQFFLLRNSYKYSEKQFTESTAVALKEVAWQLLQETGNTANFDSITPVEIVADNMYRVYIQVFDRELLKQQLIEELKKHEIYTNFEFAVFNPETEQMGEGTLITSDLDEKQTYFTFPLSERCTDYFSVHFPNRTSYFNSRLSVWYFFTALLMLVVFFFGYTLWVIIKQRQLSEIQKNFINNLTHELKTPISSIGLSAKVINNKKILETPQRLFEYTKIIQEQNNRLSKNVENVLNLASIEKNRIHLDKEDIHLSSFLSETIEHFKQSDFGQKANINTKLNGFNAVIYADKFHFSNLVINILENAVKYCEQKPEIDIELKKIKGKYELEIIDNGIGIPKEHRKKIFKKFYRVPTGNVHNVKGFGLGLDYVYKIVNAQGWKIRVEENPKGGSIFTLTIQNTK